MCTTQFFGKKLKKKAIVIDIYFYLNLSKKIKNQLNISSIILSVLSTAWLHSFVEQAANR